MKTASGYYTIHWDCPECGIHNEDLERDLNKSEGRLIGFCETCWSTSIIEVETGSRGLVILSRDMPANIARNIFDFVAYDSEMHKCVEQEIVDIPFIPFIPVKYEIPKFPTITFRYENWDLEGTLHMKDVHNDQFSLKSGAPSHSLPTLHRRMGKRPYSGNGNLRFN